MHSADVVQPHQHHPRNLPQPGGIVINSLQRTWDPEEILNHSIGRLLLARHFCFQLRAHNHQNIQLETPATDR